jgi:protein involved in polysaccharide export with SLBB domain
MYRLCSRGGHLQLLATFALIALAALANPYPAAAQVQMPPGQIGAGMLPRGMTPETIREQLRATGLTPDQIRVRLRDAGYDPNLLDGYLSTVPTMQPTELDHMALNGLQLLGIGPITPDGQPLDSHVKDSLFTDSFGTDTPADTVPTLFGLNLFQRSTARFQPLLSGPVSENYRLGPGDVLVLVLTGDVELVHTLEVTRDGFVLIPQMGQLYVNTLTLAQLRSTLYDRLGEVYSGVRRGAEATTHFEVTVARLRTNQVFVIGEVARPSSYQLSSVATVLNALYAAGGPTERGNFRRIEVRRRGTVVGTFDLYDYLLRGDTGHDIILEQGDVVFVPVHGTRATIEGAVIRPAIYELKPDDSLEDLVEAAGGFRADAALDRISISRITPASQRQPGAPNRIVVDIPLVGVGLLKAAPFPIEPGDVVTAFSLAEERRAFVELKGNVYHPGTYGWSADLKLSDLIHRAGGFRPATYAGRAHIERLNPVDSTRYLVDVRLPAAVGQPFPEDLQLHDFDIVTVYGREEFRAERTVSIDGMVNEPGTFPYREGITLRDLVLMARGLKDGALLDSAEIARLPVDRSAGQLAMSLRVPLDSSYLFETDSTTYRFLPGLVIPSREAADVPLEPFDHILILRQPEFELQRMVKITGEVRFPGTYALIRRDERISELVRRAGGVLPTGFALGGSLHRAQNQTGLVNIELDRLLDRPGSRNDLVLLPGDSLHIPEYNPVVLVTGEVNNPVSVQYRPGAGLDYYIGNAGGFTRDADKGRVSVRYAYGSAEVKSRALLLFHSSPKPMPGSTVVVPKMLPEHKTNWSAIIGNMATVAGTLGTLAAIVLTRK